MPNAGLGGTFPFGTGNALVVYCVGDATPMSPVRSPHPTKGGGAMRALMPWNRGGRTLEPFRRELEDFFQRFFEPPGPAEPGALPAWAPRVDVEETDKEVAVKADLPGVDAKDIDVSVVDGTLILRGERRDERKEKGKGFERAERFVGRFYREIPLPPGADPDKVTATYRNGVVSVTVPKKPEVQPKKVAVKALE
jgi:HSP20 family protein